MTSSKVLKYRSGELTLLTLITLTAPRRKRRGAVNDCQVGIKKASSASGPNMALLVASVALTPRT
ncbi:hypothetical protein, partial [Escherichia fergusonii]|uniref:hypothetical protein n=1 Tax=Escherichia fergusonii TaxID=564 RepID=UPI001C5C9167